MRSLFLVLPLLAISACATPRTAPRVSPSGGGIVETTSESEPEWRTVALPADVALIDSFETRWRAALAPISKRAGAAERELLDPAAALDLPELSPGSYRCRAVRLRGRTLRSYPPQFCFVMANAERRLSFNKQTGSELPNGWLYPDGDRRSIFLGAQQARPGENSLAYGTARLLDRVGVIQRIGPFRWRLVLPDGGNALWFYELTPVPAEQQPSSPS